MKSYIPLILSGVALNAFAQVSLKKGMQAIGIFSFTLDNVLPIGLRAIVNPFILAGLLCYVVSVVIWLMVLSRVEVTYAYPFLSVGYIITALAGLIFLDENMGLMRWAGVFIICVGVVLISKTA